MNLDSLISCFCPVCDEEAGIIGYFLKGSGLFSCLIDSVVFKETDVARDPVESNLGVN